MRRFIIANNNGVMLVRALYLINRPILIICSLRNSQPFPSITACTNKFHRSFLPYCLNKKLIRRRDGERELFYNDSWQRVCERCEVLRYFYFRRVFSCPPLTGFLSEVYRNRFLIPISRFHPILIYQFPFPFPFH